MHRRPGISYALSRCRTFRGCPRAGAGVRCRPRSAAPTDRPTKTERKHVVTGGTGDDTFLYESIGDGHDVITDFFDGADTIDLDELFDALNADVAGNHDGDYEGGTERTDALKFSEDGGGNLVLTIDDTENGDFEHFSITFLGLNQTDDQVAVLAAIVTE